MTLSELRESLMDASGACAKSAQTAAENNNPGSQVLAQAYAEATKALAEGLEALNKLRD